MKLDVNRAFLIIIDMKDLKHCKRLLDDIYILYIKAKISLAEAHFFRSPKDYIKKSTLILDVKYDIDVFDYIVRMESPGYNALSKKSWILFVLEINKILSLSSNDKFSIKKFYNKISNKEFDTDIPLEYFKTILEIIEDKTDNSVIKKLRLLRDKFYAHSDPDFKTITNAMFPTYDEVWSIMDEVEVLISEVYKCFDTAVELKIDNFLRKYIIEFERLYNFCQLTDDYGINYRLKRNLGEQRYLLLKSSV